MKSLALVVVAIGNSLTPIVSEQGKMEKVNYVSSNYKNKIITNNYFENIFNFLKDNESEYKNLANEFYEIASNNGIIDAETTKKLTHFQNVIFNNFIIRQTRSWNEWWGVNLWVNFHKWETENYLKILYPFRDHMNVSNGASNMLSKMGTILDELSVQLGGNIFSNLLYIVGMIATSTSLGLDLINEYFNYYNVKEKANIGHGVVSLRLTFGFIPTGIHPGYKVL